MHQNMTFPVQPDPVSGMHCWHQAVRITKAGPDDQAGYQARQLPGQERLRHVGADPGVETLLDLGRQRSSGEHQDGHVAQVRTGATGPDDLDAVEAGHHPVDEHHVVRRTEHLLPPDRAVGRHLDEVAVPSEDGVDQAGDVLVVLEHQHARHGCTLAPGVRRPTRLPHPTHAPAPSGPMPDSRSR